MKLLLSTSSSSSTASFDANLCKTKRPTSGCILGIFRRLLCSTTSLPAYQSNHITQNISVLCEDDQLLQNKQSIEAPQIPGLMARLMGLENMPVANSDHVQMATNSITRSRSMSSVNYQLEQDGLKHRHVKTSFLFREFELEDEEFFVLSFESGGKTKELRSNAKQRRSVRNQNKDNRSENIHTHAKRRKKVQETGEKVSNGKENLTIRVSHNSSQLVGDQCRVKNSTNILRHTTKNCTAHKKFNPTTDHSNSENIIKEKKNQCVIKNMITEDSSPVSVFDFAEILFDLEIPVSAAEEETMRKNSNSRRKLSPQLENYVLPSPKITKTRSEIKSRKKITDNVKCVSMWREIYKLVEGDIVRSKSNWGCTWTEKSEEFEEIIAGFEVQIMDQLLYELVDQLI